MPKLNFNVPTHALEEVSQLSSPINEMSNIPLSINATFLLVSMTYISYCTSILEKANFIDRILHDNFVMSVERYFFRLIDRMLTTYAQDCMFLPPLHNLTAKLINIQHRHIAHLCLSTGCSTIHDS